MCKIICIKPHTVRIEINIKVVKYRIVLVGLVEINHTNYYFFHT
jgi:hypothetical protein